MTLAIWCNIGLIWILTVTPRITTAPFVQCYSLTVFLKDYNTMHYMLSHNFTVAQWTCNSYYAVWLSVTDNVFGFIHIFDF